MGRISWRTSSRGSARAPDRGPPAACDQHVKKQPLATGPGMSRSPPPNAKRRQLSLFECVASASMHDDSMSCGGLGPGSNAGGAISCLDDLQTESVAPSDQAQPSNPCSIESSLESKISFFSTRTA